jgi:hypothetical protein
VNHKGISRLFFPGTAGLLLVFLVIKCLHFSRCDYTGDLFTHLQLSRDWLLGKPLFYENSYGDHSRFHNYFLDPLLAPFTLWMGAYGFFIALFGCLILALYLALRWMQTHETSVSAQLLFLVFVTSPLTYYILHDEHYGFHTEMMLLPLTLGFGVALFQRSRWKLVWALLMILVKEDAVVVVWSVLMAFELLAYLRGNLQIRPWLIRIAIHSGWCLLVFVAGFWWLRLRNAGGETRMGWVLESLLVQNPKEILASLGYLVSQRAQLTVAFVLVLWAYAGWRFALGCMLISIPVMALNFMSGTLYFDGGTFMIHNFFSLMWCPRISMYWAYWLAVLWIALAQRPAVMVYSPVLRIFFCLIFGLAVHRFQTYFFIHCDVTRIDLIENMLEVAGPNVEFDLNPDFGEAAGIAAHLPDHYPVAPMYRVFGAFNRQDVIWLNALSSAYFPPRMILASYNRDEVPDVTRVMKHPMILDHPGKLWICCEAEDTVYIRESGLKGIWHPASP